MKFFKNKFFADQSRIDFFLLVVPFVCWLFCFRYYFTGHVGLQQDAVSYADHIGYYTDNLMKGVFPLWDPAWENGVPYQFFLRRIGDVNPFFFLIVLIKWLGVSSAASYLVFLGVYYFLAGWAFYLITRILLKDRFFAFCAYVFFLFSSWGPEIFYNYIIIIFVPIVWFFYFLLSFSCLVRKNDFRLEGQGPSFPTEDPEAAKTARRLQKGHFLGMCLCGGLIVTTYIPFFFLTIWILFSALFVLFYAKTFVDLLKRSFAFLHKNKIFVSFCIIFLLVSCIPGLVFYKESRSDDFVMPYRHSGSVNSLPITVGLSNAASGDLVSHGFFDRLFRDHKHLDMGDIFLPYLFFIFILTATFARVNKLIFFLLFNILGLSLISITSASGVYGFLYDHVFFFKFMRNIYYFFWLAILPMGILLSVTAFQSLLASINSSSKKSIWLVYIIICHLIFALFLFAQRGVLAGAWAAIFISMIYFLVYFRYQNKISYSLGFCAVLLAVFIQSVQVYGFLEDRMYKIQQDSIYFSQTHKNVRKGKLSEYYVTRWFDILINYIDPVVLDNYRAHEFIFYDNVVPYIDSPGFLKIFEKSIASNVNIAYVSRFESVPGDWRSSPGAVPYAEVDPAASKELSLLSSDANTWKIKTHLAKSKFLVINDNFNSDWHAFINGRPARLLRANVSFKGLWVPSGESNIVLRFSSPLCYMLHFALIILFAGTFSYLLFLLRIYV